MQVLINGIIQGLFFALMGVAFSLVYSTTRTFHIALGAIYSLAPYILLLFIGNGPGWIAGILAALIVCAIAGLLCEEALHWPFHRKSAPPEVHLIGSLGMFLIIIQLIALFWGNDTQVLRSGVDQMFMIGNIRLAQAQLVGGAISLLVMGIFFLWLRKSKLGLQFRAMADNPILLGLLGRNVRNLRRLVFMLSALMAAIVSMATAYDVGFDPHGGLNAVLVGVVATIMGGRGSLAGAAVAGVMLGLIRSQVVWHFSARWEEAATFMLLALILFYWPQGLFGKAMRLEEQT